MLVEGHGVSEVPDCIGGGFAEWEHAGNETDLGVFELVLLCLVTFCEQMEQLLGAFPTQATFKQRIRFKTIRAG